MAQLDVNAAPDENEDSASAKIKVCYYCGTRVPADAPRCDVCGNDRSFTWTGEG